MTALEWIAAGIVALAFWAAILSAAWQLGGWVTGP